MKSKTAFTKINKTGKAATSGLTATELFSGAATDVSGTTLTQVVQSQITTGIASLVSAQNLDDQEISALELSVAGANSNISSLQSQQSTTASNVLTLQSQQSATASNVSTLQGQMTTANSNISTLQTQQTTTASNVSTHTTQIGTLNENVSTLTNYKDQAIGHFAWLDTSMNLANTDINNIKQDAIALSQRVATEEGKSTTFTNRFTSVDSSLNLITADVSTAKTDISNIKNDAISLSQRVATEEGKSTTFTNRFTSVDTSLNLLQTRANTVDASLNTLQTTGVYLASNNAFTGSTNTFSSIPSLSTDKTTSDYTSTRQLTNKAYVDAKYDTLFNSEQTFNNRVNLKETRIADWAAFASGPSGSLVNTNIEGPTTFIKAVNVDKVVAMSQDASGNGVCTFNTVPSINPTATTYTNNSIVPLSYVLSLTSRTSFKFSENAITYKSGSYYILEAPKVASSLAAPAANGEIPKCSIDISFPNAASSLDSCSLIGPTVALVRLQYYFVQANPVTTSGGIYETVPGTNNKIRRTLNPFSPSQVQLSTLFTSVSSPTASPVTSIEATMCLGFIQNADNIKSVYARPISQSYILMADTTGNSNGNITYKRPGIRYSGDSSLSYLYAPFKYTKVTVNGEDVVRITCHMPNIENNPGVQAWISSVGFGIEILSGGHVNDGTVSGGTMSNLSAIFTNPQYLTV